MPSERWKPIPGYEGFYWASSLGRIHSRYKLLTPTVEKRTGYLVMTLYSEGKRKARRTHRVHRLVLSAFHGSSNQITRHLNGIHADNRLENLTYGTHAENNMDMIRHGKTTKGTRSAQSKLTDASVVEIRKRRNQGAQLKELAQAFGISESVVSQVCSRKIWAHVP